ncbi:hypothetical protein EJB05_27652, partial [Eragrostis curvula]
MSGGAGSMDGRLLEAATQVESWSFNKELALLNDPDVLLQTTPRGNTCLHIASAHGNHGFCEKVVTQNPSLLAAINADGETPLLSAVTSGHASVASFLLRCCSERGLSEAILKEDKDACNALHHAIRRDCKDLALDLIAAQPALSRKVNSHRESPMFIAVMRDCNDIVGQLLKIPDSAHSGAYGCNAMHAAVRRDNEDIAKMIIQTRPGLAKEEAIYESYTPVAKGQQDREQVKVKKITPMQLAVQWNSINVLKVLLGHDRSLGYEVCANGDPLLVTAAFGGHVGIAREILKNCPDAPCSKENGWSYLHQAVWCEQTEFVKFVPESPQLRNKLVNMRTKEGKTALHYAVQKCNPTMVSGLLSYKEVDFTMFDKSHISAIWKLFDTGNHAKTLNWNEITIRMIEADPRDATSIANVHRAVKRKVTDASREDVKSLTEIYTTNTSLVAILVATITFAAAFTLPGGYSSDTESEGLPIMTRKLAFQGS